MSISHELRVPVTSEPIIDRHAARHPGRRSPSAVGTKAAAVAYVGSWVVGLAAFPAGPVLDAAVALSAMQLVLEVVRGLGAGSMAPATVEVLFDVVNRLDGLKMVALAVMIGASVVPFRAAGLGGMRAVTVGRVAALALIASGAGYLLLDPFLGAVAFVSLPLLLIWVGHTGWTLGRGGR